MIPWGALLCGAAAGGGLMLVVRELLPGRADLGQVLDRMDATGRAAPTAGGHGVPDRIGQRVLAMAGESLRLPRRDLDLLGIDTARHVGTKTVGAAYALLLPQLVTALAALAGASLPLPLPLAASLGLAAIVWFNADHDVRTKAEAARLEFRHAVASFLERAELQRGAKSGAVESLYRTASVGDGWVYVRIRQALDHARLAGVPPWDALKELAEQLDVPELARPAETIALAGEEGASVRATLRAQASALRSRLLTDALAAANAASEKLVVPGTVVLAAVFAVIGYPALQAIMAS